MTSSKTSPSLLDFASGSGNGLWTNAFRLLAAGNADEGIPAVVHALSELRDRLAPQDWRAVGASVDFAPVRALLHQDPYTLRGFAKPRGYAGDAVLLDYIYGCAPLPEGVTTVGRAVYDWCYHKSPAFGSVRERRVALARLLDETAQRAPGGRALALACGHLREAQLSAAFVGHQLGELVAVDHDQASLGVASACCAGLPVTCVPASVGDLLKSRVELGMFDLIYAAGLYDYLPDQVARRLTNQLWCNLRPGGKLLIANFVDCWEASYMEGAMDWYLLASSLLL